MTKLFLFTLLIAQTSCETTENESSHSSDTSSNEVTADSLEITAEESNEDSALDTVQRSFGELLSFDTTVVGKDGKSHLFQLNYNFHTAYFSDENYVLEIAQPTASVTVATDGLPVIEKADLIPSKQGFNEEIEIMAEGTKIMINDDFFASHPIEKVELGFYNNTFSILYKYYVCEFYECGVFVEFWVNVDTFEVTSRVTDFNESPMM